VLEEDLRGGWGRAIAHEVDPTRSVRSRDAADRAGWLEFAGFRVGTAGA
jgi:hypothetical protein